MTGGESHVSSFISQMNFASRRRFISSPIDRSFSELYRRIDYLMGFALGKIFNSCSASSLGCLAYLLDTSEHPPVLTEELNARFPMRGKENSTPA
jgi:hypothetical protein